jgi:molybdenum cofactor synthesis domain-containing protein
MVSVDEARQRILERAHALDVEDVALIDAHGRVLGEDVHADADLPGLPRSSVDGYAVLADDPSPVRAVLAEVTAGRLAHAQVGRGSAVRIMTGGTLPDGADAVVMVEDVDEVGERATLHRYPRAGENVHPRGMDLRDGQLVLSAGTRIGPAEVGLLATIGHVSVRVVRRPRVAVMATGDELVEPDEQPGPGLVRDSNRFALVAAAEAAGADVVWHAHVGDVEEELEEGIRTGLERADVLLTSGGVSMGTRDLIKPILERLATVHFGRVSFKPGKPLTFATTAEAKLAFGLPGFPVSSLVTFEVFVRPALLTLAGLRDVLRPRVDVALGHDVRPDPVRQEYMRAQVQWQEGRFIASTTGLQTSSRLMSMSGANALLEIEPGETTLREGTRVPALLLG